MSISATEGVSPTSSTGMSSLITSPTSTTSPDKEMFLQLLVAQLKYQDPSNPADTSQFMAQSAQFTALEKMQDVADQTKLVLGAQMAFGASSFVGRDVTYQLSDGTTGSGTVDGVSFEASGPVLDVGGTSVPLVQVLTVSDSASSGGSGSSGSSGSSGTSA